MKRFKAAFALMSALLLSAAGCSKFSTVCIDYADVFTLNGIQYIASHEEAITDEKIIDKEIGTIKFTLAGSNVNPDYKMKDGDAAFLKAGTKVYSLKSYDSKEAAAARNNGRWVFYRAMSSSNSASQPSGNGITDETYNASAMIVDNPNNGQPVRIEDKVKIKKVLDSIKKGVSVQEGMNYPQGNMYTFYFQIPDKDGIGRIVHKYYLNFQDVNLNGYVRRFNDTYRVDSSVNKIIIESFGAPATIYDSKLGGKQQIYEILADGKFILRKVVKEIPQEKFTIRVLNQGEEIWQNGSRIKDTLPGKYKVEIFMKDTKLQENIINIINSKSYKLVDVLNISSSSADEGNSSVIYLSFDQQPDLYLDETADSFVLFPKK